jgi:hypothetical protein
MKKCRRHDALHGRRDCGARGDAFTGPVMVLGFSAALACLQACGGRQEPVQLVRHEVRPDTVPCSVGPAWELPPVVIGERPTNDDSLRLSWCAEPEGSGGVSLHEMAPQRQPLELGRESEVP